MMYQYYCSKCDYHRPGLLDKPSGIGGYATDCPECGGHYHSYEVEMSVEDKKQLIKDLLGVQK